MDIFETRRRNLRLLIDSRYKGVVAKAADSLDRPPPQLHRWLSAKAESRQRMHESSARAIEEKAGIAPGWLDQGHDAAQAVSPPPLSKGAINLSADNAVGIVDAVLDSIGVDWETVGIRRELVVARLQAKFEGRPLPASVPAAKKSKSRK